MPGKPNGLHMGLRREGTHPYRVPLGAKLGLPTLAALGWGALASSSGTSHYCNVISLYVYCTLPPSINIILLFY